MKRKRWCYRKDKVTVPWSKTLMKPNGRLSSDTLNDMSSLVWESE
jgi:hypothetical protein